MKIVFFGTPQFAADVLEYLLDSEVDVAAVVTRTDKPKGRSGHPVPTPVKKLVLENYPDIPVFQPEKVSSPEFADVLPPFEADLFVVVAYGEIVKQHILDMPKLGCINLHASLLPKFRGAAPIQRAVMEGEEQTGVTVMYMVKKMDAGDMIRKAAVPVGPDETFGEVERKLCTAGSKLLLEVIREFASGDVSAASQNESAVTYAPKIELEDCEIDWTLPAQDVHNLVRGVNPYPGAWCWVDVKGQKKRLKVKKTRIVDASGDSPGEILSSGPEGLVVCCGKGAVAVLELQLEGKKAMAPEELLRGTPLTFLASPSK